MARESWVQLIPPCLTLSIIRYGSRVKWSNLGKGVVPSLHLGVVAIEKGAFRSSLTTVTNFTTLYGGKVANHLMLIKNVLLTYRERQMHSCFSHEVNPRFEIKFPISFPMAITITLNRFPHIYIYIYIEREREKEVCLCTNGCRHVYDIVLSMYTHYLPFFISK